MKNWLLECPAIKQDKLFFNFLKSTNDNQGIVIGADDLLSVDIIGREKRIYSFTVIVFKSMTDKVVIYADENIKDYELVKLINSWIIEQDNQKMYFEIKGIIIDKLEVAPIPNLVGVEQSNTQNLAKYMIGVNIYYRTV